MIKLLRPLAAAAVLFAASAPAAANAAIFIHQATLSGAAEVPSAATPGSGSATVTVDTVLRTMRVQADFSGLLGTTTAAHIHCCAPAGANAGVATTLPTFAGFPSGVSAGSYDNTFDMTDAGSYAPGFLAANGGTTQLAFQALWGSMFGGNTYLNIHTTAFPGGEIRGQLSYVPEPATWAMMIIGFGLAGTALRRRPAALAA